MLPGTAACMHFPAKVHPSLSAKGMLKLSAKCWISGSTEQFSFQLLLHRELINAEEPEQSKPHSSQGGGWLSPWSSVPNWHDTQAAEGKHEAFAYCSLPCFEWKHRVQLHPSDLARCGRGVQPFSCSDCRAAVMVFGTEWHFFLAGLNSSDNCLFLLSFPSACAWKICTKRNKPILGCQGKKRKLETNLPWRYKEGNTRVVQHYKLTLPFCQAGK